ncbi:MAG TPA: type II toxin-antitoxin system PemK/MazF family toxin [Actinomycetes bacterium]|nr:type II toxin-antitoxin system PemK/MazF family toxin [Actinomycetes bacterium]
MRRGEVWWVEHPVRGRRPYLVLTREAVIPLLGKVVAVPATRTIRGIPSELALSKDDGMPSECVLNFDNVTVIRKAHFVERICRLGPVQMANACRALAVALGC